MHQSDRISAFQCRRCKCHVSDPAMVRQRPSEARESYMAITLCAQCKAIATSLVTENDRLPHYAMARWCQSTPPETNEYDDCLCFLLETFWKCAIDFDSSKGFAFSTYALSSLRGSIRTYFTKVRGRKHSPRTDGVRGAPRGTDTGWVPIASLDAMPMASNMIADKRIAEHEQIDSERYIKGLINDALQRLEPREAAVIRRRFNDDPESLRAISNDFNVTPAMIGFVEKQAIKNLRAIFVELGINSVEECQ